MSKKFLTVVAVILIMAMCMTTALAARADTISVYGNKNDGTPIAQQGPNQMDGTPQVNIGGDVASLIDGNPMTRWGGINCNDNGDHVGLIFELKEEQTIESIDVSFFRFNERSYRITLEVSTDGGNTWTDTPLDHNMSDTSAPQNDGYPNGGAALETFKLKSPAKGKMWKLKVWGWWSTYNADKTQGEGNRNTSGSLWEVYFNTAAAGSNTPAATEPTSASQTPAATNPPATSTPTSPASSSGSSGKDSTPSTGDGVTAVAAIALVSLGAIYILKKKA